MPKNAKKLNSQKLVYVLPHKMRKSKNTRLDFGYMLRLDPRNLLKPKKMKKKDSKLVEMAKNRKRKQTHSAAWWPDTKKNIKLKI